MYSCVQWRRLDRLVVLTMHWDGELSVFIAFTPTLATGHAHHLVFTSLSLSHPLFLSLSLLPQDPDDVIEVESVHLADDNRTYVDQDDEVAESLEDKETVSHSITPSHTHTLTLTVTLHAHKQLV